MDEYVGAWSADGIEGVGPSCYNYSNGTCYLDYQPCIDVHPQIRYRNSGAAWVLIAAIIVFFMKAGFMLVELSFAKNAQEKRHVVLLKHQDAFASAFGFFLFGFDHLSFYMYPENITPEPLQITAPVLWFFKFTFASNAATIVGGCLVTNKYKLRIPAGFISAFVISGIIHPLVARIIWSDRCKSFSPYRFCYYFETALHEDHKCSWNCTFVENVTYWDRLYVLDFAGGGAVHMIGGIAGLMLCLFAMFKEWRDKVTGDGKVSLMVYLYRKWIRKTNPLIPESNRRRETPERATSEGFWEWMYPVSGGEETISEAALGLIILWFCWFAFNCGSAESVDIGYVIKGHQWKGSPFYGVSATIAINMIMSCAAGGTLAILIAAWAQLKSRTEQVNAREVANGVLSALVSITAGCAFVPYWGAMIIGFIGVLIYHAGCFLEYRFNICDTARVVPVHGLCGLWSLIATALFIADEESKCHLHAAFEGLCYCHLRLPILTYVERLGAQILVALIMIGIGSVGSFLTYFLLYMIPIEPINWILNSRIFCLNTKKMADGTPYKKVSYRGGWLLTSLTDRTLEPDDSPQRVNYGSTSLSDGDTHRETQKATERSAPAGNTVRTRSMSRSFRTATMTTTSHV